MAGPGPRFPAQGPLLSPPRLSILTAALVIDDPEERWVNGVSFQPESCGGDVERIVICPPAPVTKGTGERPEVVDVDPFAVVASDTCSAFGFQMQDFRARAERKLAACEAKQIEEELWTGSLISTNPRLAGPDADDVTVGVTPMDPADALAELENDLGECSCGGRGLIHMTRRMAVLLASKSLLRREGGLLLTPLDNVAVPGSGYPGTGPTGAMPAAGEFMYATGMVQIRRGRLFAVPDSVEAMVQGVDRAVNTITFRAERPVLALFDPCCVLAVLVDNRLTVGS